MLNLSKLFIKKKTSGPVEPESEIERRLWVPVEHKDKGIELARRIESDDLKKKFLWWNKPQTQRVMAIEEGTVGLFFDNGGLIGTLQPGSHKMDSVFERISRFDFGLVQFVVAVVQSDFYLEFGYKGLDTFKDPKAVASSDPMLLADINARLFFNISDPAVFYRQLMRGKKVIYAADIDEMVHQEVLDVFRAAFHETSYVEALRNLDTKKAIERRLVNELNDHLTRFGLSLVSASSFSFYSEQYAEMRKEDQDAAALGYQIDIAGRRRKLELAGEIDEIKDDDELAAFKAKIVKDKLLREDDIQDLEHMITMSDEERAHELEKLELNNRQDIQELQIQTDTHVKNAKLQAMVTHIRKEQERIERLEDVMTDADEMKALLEIQHLKNAEKLWLQGEELRLLQDKQSFDQKLTIEMKDVDADHAYRDKKLETEADVEKTRIRGETDRVVGRAVLDEKDKRIDDSKDARDSMERIAGKGMDAAGKSGTVVTGGMGLGGAIIGGSMGGGTDSGMAELKCPACNEILKYETAKGPPKFCGECSHQIMND